MTPKVSIIILNWNGYADTKECLMSVKKIEYKNYDIIVIDNGSTDGSPDRLEREFPFIMLIRNKENLGFAAGNNIGIKEAIKNGAAYILLLNNDTIVSLNFLSELVDVAESHPKAAIVGPKIYYYGTNDIVWSAGTHHDIFKRYLLIGNKQKDVGQFSKVTTLDDIVGCCMLIKRSVIEVIGYLKEEYYFTVEDTEYCLRARRAGYHIQLAPNSIIWHKVSRSSGGEHSLQNIHYSVRNALYLAKEYFPTKLPFIIIKYRLKGLIFLLFAKRSQAKMVFSAISDFLNGRKGRSNDL